MAEFGRARPGVRWLIGWLGVMAAGCGPLDELTQVVQGPSEVVGRSQQWFIDNIGQPCRKEISAVGGELWLYAQAADSEAVLACDTPGVQRSWGIYFMGNVCASAVTLDRPPG